MGQQVKDRVWTVKHRDKYRSVTVVAHYWIEQRCVHTPWLHDFYPGPGRPLLVWLVRDTENSEEFEIDDRNRLVHTKGRLWMNTAEIREDLLTGRLVQIVSEKRWGNQTGALWTVEDVLSGSRLEIKEDHIGDQSYNEMEVLAWVTVKS